VALQKALQGSISLFQYYHLVLYLLLSFFPLSVFLALRVVHLPWLTAGFGALIAGHLSTDGLYGLDPTSFLWRGYGLSSQLFAMIWLPLALAFSYRYVTHEGTRGRSLVPAILFTAAATAGHLGIGMIAFLSIGVLAFSQPLSVVLCAPSPTAPWIHNSLATRRGHSAMKQWISETRQCLGNTLKQLLALYGGVFLLLGYWIIPTLTSNNYHNISVWDPIWKFDSYGAKIVLTNLLNGDLFDFGRFPMVTILTCIGLFATVWPSPNVTIHHYTNDKKNGTHQESHPYSPFALLFGFWLVMYFGRTTWGPLIDLIPGMREFHLSRFIVGVHLAGLFLAPIGISWILHQWTNRALQQFPRIGKAAPLFHCCLATAIASIVTVLVYPQTIRYASHNDFLIKRANETYQSVESDTQSLLTSLSSLLSAHPGRVYAGRGGNWGRTFTVAETPYYMFLSTYGIPVILWLPQTWSPNSDTEQYFSEDNPSHYTLYNVRYVVTPLHLPNGEPVKPQPFWKLLQESSSWRLYEVSPSASDVNAPPTSEVDERGYLSTGVRPAVVSVDKTTYLNLVRLWIQSDFPKQGLYPELTFDKTYPKQTGLPNFRMLTEVLYKVPDGSIHDLFAAHPQYVSPLRDLSTVRDVTIISQTERADMVFTARVSVPPGCTECILILKQSFHPSWLATIDGKPTSTFPVFPFFTAIKLDAAGTHDVVFAYRPSTLKVALLVIALISLGYLLWLYRHNALNKIKAKL